MQSLFSFFSQESPLLSSRCCLPSRSLWFGRALLFEDRVCIRGWTMRGRYRRVLPIDAIERVQWQAVRDDVNLIFQLVNDGIVPLQVYKRAGMWNAKLHDLLGQSALAHHGLPDVPTSPREKKRKAR